MRTKDGNYVICYFSGKICYSQREAGMVITGCKKHFYAGKRHWVKSAHGTGSSKSIPRSKYYCKDCGYYHVTHIKNYRTDNQSPTKEDKFWKEYYQYQKSNRA